MFTEEELKYLDSYPDDSDDAAQVPLAYWPCELLRNKTSRAYRCQAMEEEKPDLENLGTEEEKKQDTVV